jgi:glutathione S-transferase
LKLFVSTASPFVRKVLVSAHELGLYDRIERVACAAHPIKRDMNIVAHNPLGKIPTLIVEDGTAIYDSRVICEYLNGLAGGTGIFPADGMPAIVDQALADGMLDAALLGRVETFLRPEEVRWDDWLKALMEKITSALDRFESRPARLDGRVDIGTISIGCGLSYLDLRYGHFDWRAGRPTLTAWYASFSERASFQATRLS